MKKETKKRWKKVLTIGAIVVAAGAAGYGAYKKFPVFKGAVDSTAAKVKDLAKGCLKKKDPEVAIEKPRPVYVNKHGVAIKK